MEATDLLKKALANLDSMSSEQVKTISDKKGIIIPREPKLSEWLNHFVFDLNGFFKDMVCNGGDTDLLAAIKQAENKLTKEREAIKDAYKQGAIKGYEMCKSHHQLRSNFRIDKFIVNIFSNQYYNEKYGK